MAGNPLLWNDETTIDTCLTFAAEVVDLMVAANVILPTQTPSLALASATLALVCIADPMLIGKVFVRVHERDGMTELEVDSGSPRGPILSLGPHNWVQLVADIFGQMTTSHAEDMRALGVIAAVFGDPKDTEVGSILAIDEKRWAKTMTPEHFVDQLLKLVGKPAIFIPTGEEPAALGRELARLEAR